MYFTGQSSSPSICTDRKRENSNIFTRKKYIAQGVESLHTTLTRVDVAGAILASLKRFVWHSKTSISTCLRGLFCRCPNSSFASSAGKQITLAMRLKHVIKWCIQELVMITNHKATKLMIISYQASGKASIPYWVCSSYFLCYKGTRNKKIRATHCCWNNHVTQ